MAPSISTILCLYRYDPLDRLASTHPAAQDNALRFYRKNRLATQIQGAIRHTFFGHDDQLLAQQQQLGKRTETSLLATDQQGSVLHGVDGVGIDSHAYNAYGHHSAESGLSCLIGFNGEQRDPVTGHYLLGNGYRAFNPALMRFNSPDELSPFGRGGLNAYAYCQGDPVNFRDATGRIPWPVKPLLGRTLDTLAPSINRAGSLGALDDLVIPFGQYDPSLQNIQPAMLSGFEIPGDIRIDLSVWDNLGARQQTVAKINDRALDTLEVHRITTRLANAKRSGYPDIHRFLKRLEDTREYNKLLNIRRMTYELAGHYRIVSEGPTRFSRMRKYLYSKYQAAAVEADKVVETYHRWNSEGLSSSAIVRAVRTSSS